MSAYPGRPVCNVTGACTMVCRIFVVRYGGTAAKETENYPLPLRPLGGETQRNVWEHFEILFRGAKRGVRLLFVFFFSKMGMNGVHAEDIPKTF